MNPPPSHRLSNALAGLAVGLVAAELLTGLVESFAYSPNVAAAYGSVSAMRGTRVGEFVAGIHYWGSAALLLVSAALLLALLWEGGYAQKLRWFGALGLGVAAFAFQVTGNLLPMDRHGVQTAVVEAGIAGAAPGFGRDAREFMLAGSRFSAPTLGRWWLGHEWILPALALACAAAILFSFRPRIGWIATSAIAVAFAAALVAAPLGNPATGADFGQYNATVSWYTWPFHGLMNACAKLSPSAGWVGSVGIPSTMFLLLLLAPWLGPRVSQKLVRVATAAIVVAGLGAGLAFGGAVAKLTGNRDPAVVATTGPGKTSTDPRILALAAQGRGLFNSVGCSGCHGKDGANGPGGPDLSAEWKLHADPQWYAKLIRNPKSVTPSATMPAFPQLKDADVLAISTYLSHPPKIRPAP